MNGYIDNTTELIKSLNSLFSTMTLGKFVRWILVILFILAFTLLCYEKLLSSSFHYDKLEKKLAIIEKVKKLSSNDSITNVAISKNLLIVLDNLNPPESNYLQSINLGFVFESFYENILKLIGSAILPLWIIIASRDEQNHRNTKTGAIFFIILFGLIALFIPVIYTIWVNVFVMPFAQLLVLIPFMIKKK